MEKSRLGENDPALFFLLTFILSTPLYVLNALAYWEVLGSPKIGPIYISLLTFTPLLAAALLTFRSGRADAVAKLMLSAFDLGRIKQKLWYVPVFLLGPFIFGLSVGSVTLLAEPASAAMAPVLALPAVFAFCFVLAAGEEIGWMGYAGEPLQARYGALRMALLLGLIWSLWHLPFLVFIFPDPIVLGAQLLTLLSGRVLLVWIFNNAGKSVCAVILYHAADNTALMTLPNIKDVVPLGSVMLCVFTLIAACLVILLWEWSTLNRFRFGVLPKSELK